jgi:hypothetical protein
MMIIVVIIIITIITVTIRIINITKAKNTTYVDTVDDENDCVIIS